MASKVVAAAQKALLESRRRNLLKFQEETAARALALLSPEAKAQEELDLQACLARPLVAVPLPRRPLFPGYYTSAYLKQQPKTMASLGAAAGSKKMAAAFMLDDDCERHYRGCILRPGLAGRDLLARLPTVGTLAEVVKSVPETGQVVLLGRRRVRMAGVVGYDDPLTVRVEPLEEYQDSLEEYDDARMSVACEVFDAVNSVFLKTLVARGEGIMAKYWHHRSWTTSFLADFGPATMPVYDKYLHQRALEEVYIAERMEIAVGILRQQLEMDRADAAELPKPTEFGWSYPDLNVKYTELEKEVLAEMKRARPKWKALEFDESPVATGEMPVAPSIQFRARIKVYRNVKEDVTPYRSLSDPDTLTALRTIHADVRMGEHVWGY